MTTHLLGKPIIYNHRMPPGVVAFVSPASSESIITGISVRWLYRAYAKMPARFRPDAAWVVRCEKDLTEPLEREGVRV